MPSYPYTRGREARRIDDEALAAWHAEQAGSLGQGQAPDRTPNPLVGVSGKRWAEGYDGLPEFALAGDADGTVVSADRLSTASAAGPTAAANARPVAADGSLGAVLDHSTDAAFGSEADRLGMDDRSQVWPGDSDDPLRTVCELKACGIVAIVDVMNILVRAWHAGEPSEVHAVRGMLDTIANVIERLHPEYLLFALDGGHEYRSRLHPGYKASRPPKDPGLVRQIALAERALQAMGWPTIRVDKWEADDILASAARQLEGVAIGCVLITSDKDAIQVCSSTSARIYHPWGAGRFVSETDCEEKYGISYSEMRAFLALKGDPTDDIPGVDKVGDKTAAQLIRTHRSLAGVLQAAQSGQIKGAVGAALVAQADRALLSERLVALCDTLPIGWHWSAWPVNEPRAGWQQALQGLGLFKAANRLSALLPEGTGGGNSHVHLVCDVSPETIPAPAAVTAAVDDAAVSPLPAVVDQVAMTSVAIDVVASDWIPACAGMTELAASPRASSALTIPPGDPYEGWPRTIASLPADASWQDAVRAIYMTARDFRQAGRSVENPWRQRTPHRLAFDQGIGGEPFAVQWSDYDSTGELLGRSPSSDPAVGDGPGLFDESTTDGNTGSGDDVRSPGLTDWTVENLQHLLELCDLTHPDHEFWRILLIRAAHELTPFTDREMGFEVAEFALRARRESVGNADLTADLNDVFERLFQEGSDMTSATAKKPAKKTPAPAKPKPSTKPSKPTETNDETLVRSLSSGEDHFSRLRGGVGDEEVLVAVRQRWRMGRINGPRQYDIEVNNPRWGTAIWFDTDYDDDGEPAFHSTAKPDDPRCLISAVRRLLDIPHVNGGPKNEALSDRSQFLAPLTGLLFLDVSRGYFWKDFWLSGPTDQEIRSKLNEFWRNPVANGDYYGLSKKEQPGVWISPNLKNPGDPKLSGTELLKYVKEILASRFSSKVAQPVKKASKSKGDLSAIAGVEFGPLEKWDVSRFTPSPYQKREAPTEEWLDELGNSLLLFQLEPVICRPDGELISGHTRVLAAKHKKIKQLETRTVTCDDSTAERLVLLYNAKRRDLSQRERCQHYKGLLDRYVAAGLTKQQLADDLSIDHSTLSNELSLLSLPDVLWERQESGGLTILQARRLAVHAHRPLFVEGVLAHLKTVGCPVNEQPQHHHFESCCEKGIQRAYRPMAKDLYGGGCLFKPNAVEREMLEIVELERGGGRKEEFAANVKLWNELNGAAKRKQKEKEEKRAEKLETVPDQKGAAKAKEDARRRRQEVAIADSWDIAFVVAIYSCFTGKLNKTDIGRAVRLALLVQREVYVGSRLSIGVTELVADEGPFQQRCVEMVQGFFDVSGDNGWNEVEPSELRTIARWLDVSPLAHWRPTVTLLETCTDDELLELLKEAETLPPMTDEDEPTLDRSAAVESLVSGWQAEWVPDLFTMAKPDKPRKGK